jgi:hypothetical protein
MGAALLLARERRLRWFVAARCPEREAAGVTFGLSCSGFFSSRPLRFCPIAICALL